ncbi:hypothetical protein Salat_1280600 [Sesamum alatum]|uniref:Uncharacterized protein n=1 Tax=Sesamum alatum TaxID=300844 RepID=A0AAE2CPV6_9LAMI|nr:hypothetical protein Salat_1280600 [Sesamum alatum]
MKTISTATRSPPSLPSSSPHHCEFPDSDDIDWIEESSRPLPPISPSTDDLLGKKVKQPSEFKDLPRGLATLKNPTWLPPTIGFSATSTICPVAPAVIGRPPLLPTIIRVSTASPLISAVAEDPTLLPTVAGLTAAPIVSPVVPAGLLSFLPVVA